jgi:hypothetical protein
VATSLLLIAYVLLAVGLLINWGFYDPVAVVLLLAAFTLLVVAFWSAARCGDAKSREPGSPVFAIALVGLLLIACTTRSAIYLQSESYDELYHRGLATLAGLVALGHFHARPWRRPVQVASFVAGALLACVFRIWMPMASPAPVIDTFSISQEASAFVLEGRNPYITPVTDVYGGADIGYVLPAYVYLPAGLYVQVLSYAAAGDVRYAYVVAEILTALIAWRMARRRWPGPTAECIALLFLYNPRSLFVIEQGWLDPLVLACAALSLLLRDHQRPIAASLSYGYMVSVKPYMAYALIQWLIIERNRRHMAAALLVGILTVTPFLLADWRSFVANGVLFNALIPFRRQSLTVYALLSRTLGLLPPPGLTVLVGGILTGLTWIPQRRIQPIRGFLFAVTTTLFGMFLFGSSGFCNWYYLVGGFMIFLIAASGGDRPPAGCRHLR